MNRNDAPIIEPQVPVAFVKGNDIRIYYVSTNKPIVYRASWKKSPIHGFDFVQYIAELKVDKSPPDFPKSDSEWKTVVVIDYPRWTNFVMNIVEQLAPKRAFAGAYFNFLFYEFAIYRGKEGSIYVSQPGRLPEGVEIVQRYTVREFSKVVSAVVESTLRTGNTNHIYLFVEQQKTLPERFLLLDTKHKYCVSLYKQHSERAGDAVLPFDYSMRVLTSFALESHVVSIVKNPVSTACRLLNTAWQLSAGLLHVRMPYLSTNIPPVVNNPPMDLVEWEKWLDKMSGRRSSECAVRFLIDGESYFPELIKSIKEATNNVYMRVSIFDNDDVAVDVANLLKQRGQDVKVNVLLDLLGTQTSSQCMPETPLPEGFISPRSIRSYLQRDSKVHVRAFLNPWFTADHSKLVIIDNKKAFVGGMNIGREYRYEWHDMMAEVRGPILEILKFDFEKAWSHAGLLGDVGCFLTFFGKQPRDGRYLKEPGEKYYPVRVLFTKTADREINRAIFEAINRAQNHIYIENSYVFDSSFVSALVKARRRGVDVRVVLPDRCDAPAGNSAIYVVANYLFENGVRVYLYPGMTHVKAALIDGWACFGSANFNRLSLRRNQEINLATSAMEVSERLRTELFETDFKKSYELRQAIEVNWTDHIAESILNQF
ncbi:MAG: phosphatidylserine/phosphatidylglycerophosphate/cardiolipin synthase family protein [Verrucomicrobiae bacterium]|nr:phosphatidylserine/phosphatidylglycerophosphate/cardiolipin synthase family protein [Verrucomicrobiae bacterium]